MQLVLNYILIFSLFCSRACHATHHIFSRVREDAKTDVQTKGVCYEYL